MQRFDIFADQSNVVAATPEKPVSEPAVNGHISATSNTSSREQNNSITPAPAATSISPAPPSSSSAQKRSVDPEGVSDVTEPIQPKKKRKDAFVDSDAAFAAKLQAEENLRARPTRGGNTRKAAPAKKKKTSKTSKKVKASDDSDVDASGTEVKKEVNRTGGFHVSFFLLITRHSSNKSKYR